MISRWRMTGIVAFALCSLLELGDWASLIPGYGDPAHYGLTLGIGVSAASTRLLVLTVLALALIIATEATLVGLGLRAVWTEYVTILVGILFILDGGFRWLSALAVLSKNQGSSALDGLVYLLLGLCTLWLGARVTRRAE